MGIAAQRVDRLWERYGEKELICNYWKFLGDEDRKILESQLNEDENTDTENAVLCSSCTKV
ncbi:hypothetical protein FXB78_03605 [Aggregatibacter actinomycetemcomitans]|nr:hypothetical protein FXB81_04150 [Aggregatibacter actinomycetemcomitans]TYB29567.1 hypothetical protein FXB78_03605 [Aggregatibacter actinomycetemcomitans]